MLKKQKFSYSKLNTYESCGWKYLLTYVQGHYTFTDSLASELGTVLHFVEETIAKKIKNGEALDYDELKDMFQNVNIPKTSPTDLDGGIFGINILKEKYKKEFYEVDDNGESYYNKTMNYLSTGIYRLEKYLKENPDLEVFDMEKFFKIDYKGQILSGFIDRIFHNKATDEYIIEDIKTKGKPFKDSELTTPLQFVVYTLAMQNAVGVPPEKISCVYDLPFCNLKQSAGTKGYLNRGIKKLDKIFGGIEQETFEPSPSPLCHWCAFCPTNPTQPEGGKNLCPYYSLWTRENKTMEVRKKWAGKENHEEVLADFLREEQEKKNSPDNIPDDFDFDF